MNINLVLDANAAAAPAPIQAAWTTAANMIDAAFTDNITVNIIMHYTGTGGGASGGPDSGDFYATSMVESYLGAHASPGDSTFNNLQFIGERKPQIVVFTAQEKLMGLGGINPNDTTTNDASATFATDIDPSLMVGVALREFGHAMGRVPYAPQPDIFDLFRYTAQGALLIQSGNTAPPAYFSLNEGITKWFDYGQTSDPSDFLNTPNSPLSPEDPFNEFYDGGTLQYLTPADLEQMDALGYHLKYNSPAADGHDFNGDNFADILLQSGSGQIGYFSALLVSVRGFVNVAATPGYSVMGAGKISGNTSSDFVIENASGQILYGNLMGGYLSNYVSVATTPGFNVVGVGDIDDDHHADIVLQNPGSGEIDYANIAGGVFSGFIGVGTTPGWAVGAVADINYDGFADVVIQNQSTGAIAYANMAGGVFNNYMSVANTPGFNVVGAGDINRDGFADIVVQNQSTGEIDYANMNNGVFSGFVGVGSTPGWNVTAVEDVIDNGFDDIVIQNQSTGQVDYIDMTTGTFQGFVAVPVPAGYTGHTDPTTPDNAPSTPFSALDLGTSFGLGGGLTADNSLGANSLLGGNASLDGLMGSNDGAPTDPHWMPLVGV